jgi:hypothetical protein
MNPRAEIFVLISSDELEGYFVFITKFFFCNVSIYTKLLYKQIDKHRLEAIIHPRITLGYGLGKSVLVFSHL